MTAMSPKTLDEITGIIVQAHREWPGCLGGHDSCSAKCDFKNPATTRASPAQCWRRCEFIAQRLFQSFPRFELGDVVYIAGDTRQLAYVSAYIYRGGYVEYEVSFQEGNLSWTGFYPGEKLTPAAMTAAKESSGPIGVYANAKARITVTREPQPFKIEAGKFYRTRSGRKVGPMVRGYMGNQFYDSSRSILGYAWGRDGIVKNDTFPLDLVAEWTDPPQEGEDGGESRHG